MLIKKYNNYANRIRFERFLASLGFTVVVDGVDDPTTEAAIRAFQKANALKADGWVGTTTLAAAKAKGFEGFEAVAPVTTTTEPANKGKVILVSAGHTNNPKSDRGVDGHGFVEGVEALNLRDEVADRLRKHGYNVIEDGADGVNDPLVKAIELARKPNVAVAVEFHFNGGPLAANGIEVLCKKNKKALAQKIAAAIGGATGLRLRGDRGWKPEDSGQHPRLGFCNAGGMIVEVCFMSNKSDMTAYKNNFEAIADGVANVLKAA